MKKLILLLLSFMSIAIGMQAMEDDTNNWQLLPHEAKLHIFSYLPGSGEKIKDFMAYRLISKECAMLIESSPLAGAKKYLAKARSNMIAPNRFHSHERLSYRSSRTQIKTYKLIYELFFLAVEAGDLNVAKALLVNGVVVDSEDFKIALSNHPCCLVTALEKGIPDIAPVLINHGVNVNYQKKKELRGVCETANTALIAAVENGYEDIAQLLINKGANVNIQNNFQETPLLMAAKHGHVYCAQLLLAKDAATDIVNGFGFTPLLQAAAFGQSDIIELLLSRGGNVNEVGKDGITLLMIAVRNGRIKTIESLLASGAEVNVQTQYCNGMTPLMMAAHLPNRQIIEILLEYGAQTDLKDSSGSTARDLARCQSIVELLDAHEETKTV